MSVVQLFSLLTAEQTASLIKEDLNSFIRSELERTFNEAPDGDIEDFLLEASSVPKECIEVTIGAAKDGRRQILDFRAVPQEGGRQLVGFPEFHKRRA